MRQLTYRGPSRLVWEDVAEPRLSSPESALVRPIVVATCDLDTALLRGSASLPGPFPLGHEFVAEVIETGSDVRGVTAGQRVLVPFQISCGSCHRCLAGQTAHCASVPPLSGYGLGPLSGMRWGGALSDVVLVPFADAMLVGLPDDLDPTHLASLSDNLPDAWRTVASVAPGDEVLVVGGGSIGLYATGLAVGLGAQVAYVDPSAERCAVAEAYGAEVEQRPLDDTVAARSLVVHTSADPAQLRHALLSTDLDGLCIDTGMYFTNALPLPMLEMFTRGIEFRTSRAHARRDLPAVLAEVRAGRFDPSRVTSAVVDWDGAPEALLQAPTKLVVSRLGDPA
jgi:alcohol dehydrogenase